MERCVLEYYTALYAPANLLPQHEHLESSLLDIIPPIFESKFSAECLETLGAVPDQQEIHAAVKAMASGKSPGPDGVVVEFYRHFWDLVGPDFTAMLQAAIASGALPNDVNKGLIVLLPKEGDLELLPNWRPITLLNTSYKIFAKLLQIRL